MSLVLQPSKTDRLIDSVFITVLSVFGLATLFPLYYVVVMSVTPFIEVIQNGGFVLLPKSFTLEAYKQILSSVRIPRALGVTVILAVGGTFLNLLFTMLLAYPLSKRMIPGRNYVLFMIVFTMLFSGGLIPLYLIVNALGMNNTLWALIVPGLVSAFNMLIMKTYFEGLPEELEEAARVDGCGELRTLFRIILPLSMPIMATLGLFYGINHWNTYFHAIMFITDKELQPIQVVLRSMIVTPNVSSELQLTNQFQAYRLPPETMKMAAVVVTILPIIVIYPFLQKHFMKGFLLGSIKG
ncbi:carbohydrate ABC transporter permease [Paenibacillus eucommiae]|uniref:Aldouronate transport system permease protein n=1 Tax=Paenibacillus eucommiae TaxID=1355755 RepID=A0ABS4J069_9BACL|nr:carbohydrate ABC transporter permease [Paenibacillus eucommiae]MBP1993234.1 putative aldouronate transport system permease protein [Paenibacillus eucommiae]